MGIIAGKKHEYTRSDVSQALEDSGLAAARKVYDYSENAYLFDRLGAPGVAVDCIYGIDDQTVNGVHFGDGFNEAATGYTYEDGDGVATKRSLSLCAQWSGTGPNATKVSIYSFPHIGHGGTLHSKESVQQFAQIMRSMHTPAGGLDNSAEVSL